MSKNIEVGNMVSFEFNGFSNYGTVAEINFDIAVVDYPNPVTQTFESESIPLDLLTLIGTHPRIIKRNKY